MIDYFITEDGTISKGTYIGNHTYDFVELRDVSHNRIKHLNLIKNSPYIQKEVYKLFLDEIKKLETQIEAEKIKVLEYFDKNWTSANEWKKQAEIERVMAIIPGFKEWQVAQLKNVSKAIMPRPTGKNNGGGWVEPELIEIANRVPIHTLMKFDSGNKALCLWHDEKTPSLSYNREKNYVKCFGQCGEVHSAIDVYQKINNCDFVTAVKALSS